MANALGFIEQSAEDLSNENVKEELIEEFKIHIQDKIESHPEIIKLQEEFEKD